MKRHSFVGSLLTATLATGLLLVGGTSASAQNTEPAPTQPGTASTDLKNDTTTVLPPILSKARFTCSDEGAGAVAKLHNPNTTVQAYMVSLSGGDYAESYVVDPAAHSVVPVEFACVPNGTYLLSVQNVDGDLVAQTRVIVQCNVKPTETPTGTPPGTPTGTPTTPPSETPSTSPPTTTSTSPGTSPATTTPPSTPVAVPTAVNAGLPGPAAHDDSNHDRMILGAGLLAAVAIMIGLGAFLIRRRRGLHQI